MLNRKIPYGEVFGMPGVKYEQNGKSYDSRGNEIGTKTVEVLVEKGQVEQVQVAVKLESDEESKESPVETEDGIPVIPDFEQPEIRKRPAVMTVAEMKAELDGYGVKYYAEAKMPALRSIVASARREHNVQG